MVLPVTGPYNMSAGSSGGLYSVTRKVYKQAKPIDRPLRYEASYRRVVSYKTYAWWDGDSSVFGAWCPNTQNGYANAINETAHELRSKVSDQALWAVNLAEYNESVRMMTQRLIQLGRFARAVSRRDFGGIVTSLGLAPSTPRRPLRKRAADTWLEYSFGWKPLIQDVYSTLDLLQNPIKAIKVDAKRSYNVAYTETFRSRVVYGIDFCRSGCEVSVSNPNLYLANNLGLVNPAVVVWELIPFSFVVDWFANVGQFLSSGTDWLGLTVTKPYCSFGTRRTSIAQDVSRGPWVMSASYMQRMDSLAGVSLIVRPSRLWGWRRAANAAAVLSQVLGGR